MPFHYFVPPHEPRDRFKPGGSLTTVLNFLATLGMAAMGLWVFLFLVVLALAFWRQLAAAAAAVAALGVFVIAAVLLLVGQTDDRRTERLAQQQHAADLQTARRQDERDKLRASLERDWSVRSAQCIAEQQPDLTCNPARFAVVRMRAFHAAKLPSPRDPPPNMDAIARSGIVWDANLGELKFEDKIIYLEDLAQAVDKGGAVGPRDLRGKSKDDEYRGLDQEGRNARERLRVHMDQKHR